MSVSVPAKWMHTHRAPSSETKVFTSVSNYLMGSRIIAVLCCGLLLSVVTLGQQTDDKNIRIHCPLPHSKPTKIVRPTYPELAKQAGVEGRVSLRCFIGPDGSVERIEVTKGHPLLIEAATHAVAQWIYKPLVLNGKAVKMETTVEIDFRLPKASQSSTSEKPHS
jgi:TonB family protein